MVKMTVDQKKYRDSWRHFSSFIFAVSSFFLMGSRKNFHISIDGELSSVVLVLKLLGIHFSTLIFIRSPSWRGGIGIRWLYPLQKGKIFPKNECPVCLLGFYGISAFVGYLTPIPFFIQIVLFQTIQFSMSTQFNCQKHFYFKLLSLVKQFYFKQLSLA